MNPRPSTLALAPMTAATWGMLLLLGFIWGGSFFFARIAVQHIPPVTLVLVRVFLAALALHVYLRGRYGLYRHLRRLWPSLLLLGLLNNAIPFTLIFAGELKIGAGLASVLNATTPLWTVLVTHFFTSDEKLSPGKLTGCMLGFGGTVLLIGPDALRGLGAPIWAQLAVVGASLSYAFANVVGKRFTGIPAPITATGQLTASTLLMLPVSLIVDQPWHLPMPPAGVVAAVLALALLSTAFAYILFFRIMQLAGATNVSLVTFLVPPSAILLGSLFLGERLDAGQLTAMALIAAGLVCLDGRLYRAWRNRRG